MAQDLTRYGPETSRCSVSPADAVLTHQRSKNMTKLRIAAALAGIVGCSLPAGGCLQKEVTATWYLGSDASLTWQAVEKGVRAESETLSDRQQEEQTYMAE